MNQHVKYYSIAGILSICSPLLLHAQNMNIITDVNTETGTQLHVACKEVILGPGYNFTPQSTSDRMQAYIDPYQVCDVNYTTGGTGNFGGGTPPTPFNTGAEVGTIAGRFNVSPTGAANYNILLIVP